VGHPKAVSRQSRTGKLMYMPHPWLATADGYQVLTYTHKRIIVTDVRTMAQS